MRHKVATRLVSVSLTAIAIATGCLWGHLGLHYPAKYIVANKLNFTHIYWLYNQGSEYDFEFLRRGGEAV